MFQGTQRKLIVGVAAAAWFVIASGALAQAGDPGFGTPSGKPPAKQSPGAAPTSKPDDAKPTTDPREARTYDLRPRFKQGDTLRYTYHIGSQNKMAPVSPSRNPDDDSEVTMDQTQDQTIGLAIKVVESGDSGAKLQVVYESIKMSMDMPGGRAVYDSAASSTPVSQPAPRNLKQPANAPKQLPIDKEMSDLLAQLMKPMVGTTIEVHTDASGAIKNVSGGDALSGAGAFAEILKGITSQMGGAGGMPSMPTMPALPAGGASANWLTAGSGSPGVRRIGETWSNNDTLSGTPAGGMSMVTTHTLRSVSGELANVSFQGKAAGNSSSGGGSATGVPGISTPSANLEGSKYAGEYVWDLSAGALKQMKSEMSSATTGNIGDRPVRMTSLTNIRVDRK